MFKALGYVLLIGVLFFAALPARADSWLPNMVHYINGQVIAPTNLAAPNWDAMPAETTTELATHLRWSAVPGASVYELWSNGSKTLFSNAEAVLHYTQAGLKQIKVRACRQDGCGAFSELAQINVATLMTSRITNANGQALLFDGDEVLIGLNLADIQGDSLVEYSLDGINWHTAIQENGQYQIGLGSLGSNAYSLKLKVAGQDVSPLQFVVAGQPSLEVYELSVSNWDDPIQPFNQAVSTPLGSKFVLHWQPSPVVAEAPIGYYRVYRNGQPHGLHFGVAGYLKHKYQDNAFHVDYSLDEIGKMTFSVRACNRMGEHLNDEVDCGPAAQVWVYSGLDIGSPVAPSRPVDMFAASKYGQPIDDSLDEITVEPGETFYLHWATSNEVEPPTRGFYRIVKNGRSGGFMFGTVPYLKRRFNDDLFHIDIALEEPGEYVYGIRPCNRIDEIDGVPDQEECGPVSRTVKVKVASAEPELDIQHTGTLQSRQVWDTDNFTVRVQHTGGAAVQSLAVSLDGTTWVNLNQVGGEYSHSFQRLAPGNYQLYVRANNKVLTPLAFDVIRYPTQRPAQAVSALSISLWDGPVGAAKSVQANLGDKVVLHWRGSTQVAPQPYGYYQLMADNGTETIIVATAPQLQQKYQDDLFHFDKLVVGSGRLSYQIAACNRLAEVRNPLADCGPGSEAIVFADMQDSMGVRWASAHIVVGETVDLLWNAEQISRCEPTTSNDAIKIAPNGQVSARFFRPSPNITTGWRCYNLAGEDMGEFSVTLSVEKLLAPQSLRKQRVN